MHLGSLENLLHERILKTHLVHEKVERREIILRKSREIFLFDWSFKRKEHEKITFYEKTLFISHEK